MEIKNKRVLVVGLGKSGVASAIFLKERGARVSVSDAKTEDQLRSAIPALLDKGISVETGGHGERTFRDQDLIVVSPGVPSDVPQLEKARAAGIPIIGEVELASRFLKGHIIAITGSNGKTTTTALAGEVIGMGGYEVLVGGNIGTPAISLVSEATTDTYNVLEISSFQLESIESFHPEIAVVLNITPDHLDRHHSFDAYVQAKARIFENQTAEDYAVLNADDSTCAGLAGRMRAQVYWFTRTKDVDRGAFVRDGKIFWRDDDVDWEVMPTSSITLKGAHNLENVLAAVCVGRIVGCEPHRIRRAVEEFKAVEHRLEYVTTIQGVEYYNDSKATNVDATTQGARSLSRQHPHHSRRQGQRQRLLGAERPAALHARSASTPSAQRRRRSSRRSRVPCPCSARKRWKRRSSAPPSRPPPETSCSWRRPAPASISLKAMSTAAVCSRK